MPDLIITPDVVERGARAMYTASLANAGPHRDTWDDLPAYWRATLTTLPPPYTPHPPQARSTGKTH